MADERKLFVGQLPNDVTEEELRIVFGTYGKVASVHTMDGKPAGSHKCAFVNYEKESSGRDAVQVLHDIYKFRSDCDQAIRVSVARPSKGKAGKGGKDGGKDDHDVGGHGGGKGGHGNHQQFTGNYHSFPPPVDRFDEDRRKVLLGNLPLDIRDDEIRTILNTYGRVLDVRSLEIKNNARSAVVMFDHEAGPAMAISALHNVYKFRIYSELPVRCEAIRGRGVMDMTRIYIGLLPEDIREDEVRFICSTYGQVIDAKILDPQGARGNKSGFVTFATEHGAREAIQCLNGIYRFRVYSEVPVRVEYPRPEGYAPGGGLLHFQGPAEPHFQPKGKGKGGGDDADQLPKVFVGQLPLDIKEDEIEIIFRTYGQVKHVSIADGKGGGTKIAFVEYANLDQCRTAMSSLDENYKFRRDAERPIKVSWAKFAPRKGDKGDKGGKGGKGDGGWKNKKGGDDGGKGKGKDDDPENRPPGPKVHVANLPTDITKEQLEIVFGTYGPISDVYLMHRQNGPCAGFVTYEEEQDAAKCIAAMQQGYEIRPGQGNIHVTYAKVKGGGQRQDRRYNPY